VRIRLKITITRKMKIKIKHQKRITNEIWMKWKKDKDEIED